MNEYKIHNDYNNFLIREQKLRDEKAPRCHNRPMQLEEDSDSDGRKEKWWECTYCGHQEDV